MLGLLTSDFHSRPQWYEWLVAHAKGYDFISVAGDLVEDAVPTERKIASAAIARIIAGGTPVALCSGNHDREYVPAQDCLGEAWWIREMEGAKTIVDRRHAVVGDSLLISSNRYVFNENETAMNEVRAEIAGAAEAGRASMPWLMLQHNPPQISVKDAFVPQIKWPLGESVLLPNWISEFRPDFVHSGHLHDAPYYLSFAHQIGSTWCLNAGSVETAPHPNYIVLDTESRMATWHYFDLQTGDFLEETRHLGAKPPEN